MSLRDPVLVAHVAAGTAGLVLGPIAMTARKRRGRHTRAGLAYHWLVAVVCASAVALALMDWHELWWFVPIAAFSYANALLGYLAVRIRWRGWLREHIAGMGGSYIALVTALIVVNAGESAGVLAWFGPTLIGTPVILVVTARVARGPLGAATRRRTPGHRPRRLPINVKSAR